MDKEFARVDRIRIRDPNSTAIQRKTLTRYQKSDIEAFLSDPSRNEQQLRDASLYLSNISNEYRRLIAYYANMPTYAHIIKPLSIDTAKADKDKFKAQYLKVKRRLEVMSIPHEFNKVLNIAFRDDIFYGYVHETKDSFVIQPLDARYCMITSIVDGVFCFAWDSSYFARDESLLEYYPDEFRVAYDEYKTDSRNKRWFNFDPLHTICIKINETEFTPIPPLVSLFSTLLDIEDYRAIAKNANEISNYKVLALKMPVDKDGELMLPKSLCEEAFTRLAAQLPKGIGVTLTPLEITEWKFEQGGSLKETNLVSTATDMFWNGAGVSGLLFGIGDNPSAAALNLSIKSDEDIVFRVLRQLERWVNFRLKKMTGAYKFQIRFLDMTRYSQQDAINTYSKMGQYGMPVRMSLMAAGGYSPSETEDMAFMENEMLELYANEIPLQSSNTISGEVGRPTNESKGEGLTDSGEETQENDTNNEN